MLFDLLLFMQPLGVSILSLCRPASRFLSLFACVQRLRCVTLLPMFCSLDACIFLSGVCQTWSNRLDWSDGRNRLSRGLPVFFELNYLSVWLWQFYRETCVVPTLAG